MCVWRHYYLWNFWCVAICGSFGLSQSLREKPQSSCCNWECSETTVRMDSKKPTPSPPNQLSSEESKDSSVIERIDKECMVAMALTGVDCNDTKRSRKPRKEDKKGRWFAWRPTLWRRDFFLEHCRASKLTNRTDCREKHGDIKNW